MFIYGLAVAHSLFPLFGFIVIGYLVYKTKKPAPNPRYGNELTRKLKAELSQSKMLKMEYLNEQYKDKKITNKEYEQSKKEYEQYIKEKQYKEMYNEMEDWDI